MLAVPALRLSVEIVNPSNILSKFVLFETICWYSSADIDQLYAVDEVSCKLTCTSRGEPSAPVDFHDLTKKILSVQLYLSIVTFIVSPTCS